jgi:hypothetical protein
MGNFGEMFARAGADDIDLFAAVAVDPFAANEKF